MAITKFRKLRMFILFISEIKKGSATLFYNSFAIPICMSFENYEVYKKKLNVCYSFFMLLSFLEIYIFNNLSYLNSTFFCLIALISFLSVSNYFLSKICAALYFFHSPCLTFVRAFKEIRIENFRINNVSIVIISCGALMIPEIFYLSKYASNKTFFLILTFFAVYAFIEGFLGLFLFKPNT